MNKKTQKPYEILVGAPKTPEQAQLARFYTKLILLRLRMKECKKPSTPAPSL